MSTSASFVDSCIATRDAKTEIWEYILVLGEKEFSQ